jgi:hypothetical protein
MALFRLVATRANRCTQKLHIPTGKRTEMMGRTTEQQQLQRNHYILLANITFSEEQSFHSADDTKDSTRRTFGISLIHPLLHESRTALA